MLLTTWLNKTSIIVKLEDILSKSNLSQSLDKVIENAGAPGIDGVTVKELRQVFTTEIDEIKRKIFEGIYLPSPVRRVEIPKPQGGKRQLGIPTVLDRVIQQAIATELDKLYDGGFSERSYGFRRGRSCHQALDQAMSYLNSGSEWIVEIDLEKFFDRVNHDRLMTTLSKRITDKGVLKLIRSYLTAGAMENGVCVKTEEGTPQGGNMSPVLSNIVLDELDKELEIRGLKYVRYADDITIFASSERAAKRILEKVTEWIESVLKLKVNREKSGISRPSKGQLLGFGFYHGKGGEVRARISTKSYDRLKMKVKKITSRSWSVNMGERLDKLYVVTNGWINYYAKADGSKHLRSIDEWIRSRLRMCIWKQWKRVRTRIRSLIQLGVEKQQAIAWANTRKSYWRTAHSPILMTTITDKRLEQKGYVSMTKMYQNRRNILTNRRDTRTVRPVV